MKTSSCAARAVWGTSTGKPGLDTLGRIDTRALDAVALDECSFGDVVVVAGRWTWDASLPERDLSGEYSMVDVLLWVDGRWRPRWRISTKMDE